MLAGLLLLNSGLVLGVTVRTVNFAEMISLSNRVFLGRCVKALPLVNEAGLPVMEYTFEVAEDFKGTKVGQPLVFRQLRTPSGGMKGLPGVPGFKAGQEAVVFLHSDSRIGLTSPVGLQQGVFAVQRDNRAEPALLNSLGNQNLGASMTDSTRQTMGLSSSDLGRLQESGPIPLSTFRKLFRRIAESQIEKGGSIQ